ncbi:DUF6240 domain-containing protein [Serpentinicella alkaliphila]|uniref:Flagellar hook-length control protein FliK n=1 Tax=Serpentinicella alkaliphila TaxID=1734049 RepID=A0A4V2T3L1_9FIRM|nr:DUF6240 domain-containing protein [Serpentinicella alkaliphila]TCQ01824.1 hypothetical protein EDD79_102222 [Serpentinicella alkaliphila]
MNQIFGQSLLRVFKHSYDKIPSSSKIRGVLVDINGSNVKLDLGGNKTLEVKLKEEISAEIGDTVVIDKSNIEKSEVVDKEASNIEDEKSINILRALQVPETSESEEALKALEKFNLTINKSNIQSFVAIKRQLNKLIDGLDYDTAIKLIEKNVNIQNDSIQKIAEEIENVKNEKKSFSFSDLFKFKKEMKTEEAEQLSIKIFGSKMGKDVVDAIKSLHKSGVEITKENIYRINDILNKVDDIQSIKEETLIELVKNKVTTSIDNLYKIKNNIIKGSIQSIGTMASYANRAYEGLNISPKVSEKDLRLLEDDIKTLLSREEIEISEDTVNLSKNIVKQGLDLTKENIKLIKGLKDAVKELTGLVSGDKASILIKAGLEIEKIDIREIAEKLKNIDQEINRQEVVEKDKLDKTIEVEKIVKVLEKMDDQQLINLIKRGGDIKLETLNRLLKPQIENKVVESIENESSEIKVGIPYSFKLSNLIDRVKNVNDETIAREINLKRPITLESLSNRVVENKEVISTEQELKALDSNGMSELQSTNNSLKYIKDNLSVQMAIRASKENIKLEGLELVKLSQFINEYEQNLSPVVNLDESDLFKTGFEKLNIIETISSIEIDTLSYQINNKLPMTLNALKLSQQFLDGLISKEDYIKQMDMITETKTTINMPRVISPEIESRINAYINENAVKLGQLSEDINIKQYAKSLIQNNIPLNTTNLLNLHEKHKQLEFALENITDNFNKITMETKDILSLDIKELAKPYDNEKKPDIQSLIKNISNIKEGHRDSIISLLMKNALPVNLKEVTGLFNFLGNKEQIGSNINEILNILKGAEGKEGFKELAASLKDILNDLSISLKTGKGIPEKPYHDLGKVLQSIESKSHLLEKETKDQLRQVGEKLFDSLELQVKLNKEDNVYQVPYMFNDQLKNLQLYVMNNKKGSKKIDPNNMSILLNFDTNNMGNLNIYVGVNHKRVVMKMGLQAHEDKAYIEKYTDKISNTLKQLGYELKDISYNISEQNNILEILPETNDSGNLNRTKLDIKI